MKFPTKYKLNNDTQSVAELWESIRRLSTGRCADNNANFDDYPLAWRCRQLDTLKALVQALEETHNKMLAEEASEHEH